LTNERRTPPARPVPRPQKRDFPTPLEAAATSAQAETPVAAATSRTRVRRGLPPRPVRSDDEPPSLLAAPLPARVEEEPYDDFDEYGDYAAYDNRQESFLRNPYVLAGLAVAAAIVLAIIVVVMASSGGTGEGVTSIGTIDARTPLVGIVVESITTSSVREGPGTDYPQVGTLPRGQKVQVTGRNEERSWFQIVFPQNSPLRGWVPASALRAGDLASANVEVVPVTPISRPTIIPPTQPPRPTEPPEPTEVPATVTPTAEPEPAGPDIAVALAGNCVAGGAITVVITNAGAEPITGRSAGVTIASGLGSSSTAVSLNLAPGASASVSTGQIVQSPRVTVTAQLQGTPPDAVPGNNSASCDVTAPPPPPPTATPPVVAPTPTTPAAVTPVATPAASATP
jgi:uncharacterized protein YraI